jgi:hypothetical protein
VQPDRDARIVRVTLKGPPLALAGGVLSWIAIPSAWLRC